MSTSRDNFASMDATASEAPDRPASTVQSCPYAGKVRLRIALRDESFGVHANQRYLLQVGGETFRGVTSAKGLIDHLIPKGSTEARLQVWPSATEGTRPLEWKLALGKLLPVSTLAGAQARLANLGFACELDGASGPKTRAALESFQAQFELEQTGTLDPETQQRLEEVYRQPKAVAEPRGQWKPRAARPFKPSKTRATNPPVPRVRDE